MWSPLPLALAVLAPAQEPPAVRHPQGALVGEVTATSALLQTRLAGAGFVLFEVSADATFERDVRRLGPVPATPDADFIARVALADLRPRTPYYWRTRSGTGRDELRPGPEGSFRTLPGAESVAPVTFAVVTGMNQQRFLAGDARRPGYDGADKDRGYPALASIRDVAPDFVVFTGDSVYYDHPREGRARTIEEMRAKWHAQLAQPRFHELFASVPTFWMKDDHDHRFNDCDTTGDALPSSDLGIAVFLEQAPILPAGADGPTWRTVRASRDLQLWFVEGRDHRSPNALPDGPDKTLWGAEQLAWLRRTLLASDASHRILVSPTPLVGPDDAYKSDNHTNPKGFRHEGDAFLAWVVENELHQSGFFVVCGDRHWQYHSIHPLGVEELSSGALVDANARLGRKPGDPQSTDPDATIRQPYTSAVRSGGFLVVRSERDAAGAPALHFVFHDEHGAELYRCRR